MIKSIYEIRAENLREIRKRYERNFELAEKLGLTYQRLGQLLSGRQNIVYSMARKIEQKLELEENSLDVGDFYSSTMDELFSAMKSAGVPPQNVELLASQMLKMMKVNLAN